MSDHQETVRDTTVTRTYATTDLDDDAVSIPEAQKLKKDVVDLLRKDGKTEKADGKLKYICQTFSSKVEIDPPLPSK